MNAGDVIDALVREEGEIHLEERFEELRAVVDVRAGKRILDGPEEVPGVAVGGVDCLIA